MGETRLVDRVKMWGRTGCCWDRMGWAEVIVSETDDYTQGFVCRGVEGSFFQNDPMELTDCRGASGQFVPTPGEYI